MRRFISICFITAALAIALGQSCAAMAGGWGSDKRNDDCERYRHEDDREDCYDHKDRYSRYRDDPEWQFERQRRRIARQLREEEERRLYREWLEASTVTCMQAGMPVFTFPQARTIVTSVAGTWPQITFSDPSGLSPSGASQRTISLLSRTLSCAYQRHDRDFRAGDGTVWGGAQSTNGSTRPFGPQIITCFRGGVQIAQERVTNVTLSWNGLQVRLDFERGPQQPDSVVIDGASTGCILEAA